MTLLQKAYQTLNQDKKEKKPFSLELKRPERDIEFIPFNIPQVRSVKCTKEKGAIKAPYIILQIL